MIIFIPKMKMSIIVGLFVLISNNFTIFRNDLPIIKLILYQLNLEIQFYNSYKTYFNYLIPKIGML